MNTKKARFNFYNSTASLLEVMSAEVCKDFMINLCAYMTDGKLRGFTTNEAKLFWSSQEALYTKQRKAYEVYLAKGNQYTNNTTPKTKEKPAKALKKDEIPYNVVIDYFHNTCKSLPKVLKLTDTRKRNIKNRLKEHGNEAVAEVFKKANDSDYLNARNGSNFKANIDFVLNKTKFVRILEGNYDNNKKTSKKTSAIETIINKRKNLC